MKNWPGKDRGAREPRPVIGPRGKVYWRSVEDYANTKEFRAWAEREFPALASELDRTDVEGGTSRRRFLQLMGASLALAGMGSMGSGCKRPEHQLRARDNKPAEQITGRPLFFATTMVMAGQPIGLLVETHEGRPTKIEGNPSHPASLGATHVFAQASVLDLYDPDRSRTVLNNGRAARYTEDFLTFVGERAGEWKSTGGKGLAILSEDYASPAVEMLREHIVQVYPEASFHVYEPTQPIAATPRAVYALDQAKVILSLDCDFLGLEDAGTRYRRQFADGRRVTRAGDQMNRLYVVEPGFTLTGAAADHRLRLAARDLHTYVRMLGGEMGVEPGAEHRLHVPPQWIREVAADLKANAGRCVVAAGARHPGIQSIVARINHALGNMGKTVGYVPVAKGGDIADLARRLNGGDVRSLVILGGNPAYDAPADLEFATAMAKVGSSIHLSLHVNETLAGCTWHVPAAHYLESWGDARDVDGTVSAVQPMIEPLFGGITPLEMLARVGGYDIADPYEIAQRSFSRIAGKDNLEAKWRQFLHEGVYRGTGFQPVQVPGQTQVEWPAEVYGLNTHATEDAAAPSASNIEVCFATDESVFDGRFANNGWMQECPGPMTKLVWDNAALMSPVTAGALDVKTGDVVRIELAGRSLEIAAFVMPGLADYSITLPLGYGRNAGGVLADGMGANAYALRTSRAMGFAAGAKVIKTGRLYPLATTQEHWSIAEHHIVDEQVQKRGIVREGTLAEYAKEEHFAAEMGIQKPTALNIYTSPELTGPHQWGMVIDLTTCIGCSACVVACQAENNIPIVGKDEVIRGREMHWMRLDRYFRGDDPAGEVTAAVEPMLCQHCGNAPCEPVCPVNATVHDSEGLNAMVYNRCIGTRYCSNNCPYKVRRFNFFDWNKGTLRASGRAPFDGDIEPNPTRGFSLPQLAQPPMQELLKMQKNPEVTVRMRGVMEKCTFCVQRIKSAEVEKKVKAGQTVPDKVPDGMARTACQQVCPTRAIEFGDISDPDSRVSQARQSARNYEVLGHLNTRPRTTYLARLRNVNERMLAALADTEVTDDRIRVRSAC